VAFREVNVAEDLEGQEELLRRTGQLAVPVTVVDDEVIVGFNRPRLVEVLRLSES
jgi:glutaredoxin 3